MAIPKRNFVALCLSVLFFTGCTSIKMVRNPGEGDPGVRFYRPKPYLLITPADPTGRLVNMKLEYLPDFNEEYSAHLSGKASVALKDGWNLVGVNTKDAPKDKEEPPAKIEDIKIPPAVVSATNVPIGYYESVYGFAGEKKFLQGWRYIGSTVLGGNQPNVCRVAGHTPNCPPNGGGNPGCMSGPLYGLVFFNGVMTFRQLDEIANNQLCPMYVNPTPAEPTAPVMPNSPPRVLEQPVPNTPPGPKVLESTPPPTPSPTPPSTSYSLPKPMPALIVTKPAVAPAPVVTASKPVLKPVTSLTLTKPAINPIPVSPSLSQAPLPPARVATTTTKPAASQGVYVPLTKTPTTNTASTASVKTTPSMKPVTTPSSVDPSQLPSLDQDLFQTGSSPRP